MTELRVMAPPPADASDQPRVALFAAFEALWEKGDVANAEIIVRLLEQRSSEDIGELLTDELADCLFG